MLSIREGEERRRDAAVVPARPPGPLGAPPMPPVRPPRCPVPRHRPRRRWLGTAGSRSSHPGTEALARPLRARRAAPRRTPASPWRRCAPAAVPRPPPRARASHRPRRAPAAGLRPTRPPGSTARDSDDATPRPGAAGRGLSALQPPAFGLTPSAPPRGRPFPEPGPWGLAPAAGGADADPLHGVPARGLRGLLASSRRLQVVLAHRTPGGGSAPRELRCPQAISAATSKLTVCWPCLDQTGVPQPCFLPFGDAEEWGSPAL
ncbi:serine/arginine repetitive matrix protein 1-like [Phodopus roborovskii]|uniref:serine/arginine repetitive matrix protein 1-like n=1 Tax=Phodopus roborovskii TaxID=109678 RepID=UPI0021E516A2|nr:serine/arginine repetitive matrix protein 1-like [Phodopus roborovskii]